MAEKPPAEPSGDQLALDGRPLPRFDRQANDPIGTTPARRAGSVRRTMSIDTHWPSGIEGEAQYFGRCRDILTPEGSGQFRLLAEATLVAACAGREIKRISAYPCPARLQDLVGVRAGGQMREALASAIPEEKQYGVPLYLLLDDMAGATLVSRWATSQWPEHAASTVPDFSMEGVCIGFRPGSSALDEQGRARASQNTARVVPLRNEADPMGWHDLPALEGVNFRRARRIDLWPEHDGLRVESHFQDSASAPDGGNRIAIHEYLLEARIGPDGRLQAVEAKAGTLPYRECRAAPANLNALSGTPTDALREIVLEKLKLTHGCTHLNDMMRSLAEVPALASNLRR